MDTPLTPSLDTLSASYQQLVSSLCLEDGSTYSITLSFSSTEDVLVDSVRESFMQHQVMLHNYYLFLGPDYQFVLIKTVTTNGQLITSFVVSVRGKHEWSITVAIVAQWQSTDGHNQLS